MGDLDFTLGCTAKVPMADKFLKSLGLIFRHISVAIGAREAAENGAD